MKGARKAVLKIAALSSGDRDWLLQQLEEHERALLSDAESDFSQSTLPGNLAFDDVIELIEKEELAEKKFVAAKGFWSKKNEQSSTKTLTGISPAIIAVLASSLDQASMARLQTLLGENQFKEVLELLEGRSLQSGSAVNKAVDDFFYQSS